MSDPLPPFLVETEWLAAHLHDPDLRILDCTVLSEHHPDPSQFYLWSSGRERWAAGHIPGAVYADLLHELSAPDGRLWFTMPSAEQFAAVMSGYGVGEDTRVVLYDSIRTLWAARVWWMLRAFGFDQAAVLNGGWRKWSTEGRPVSTDPPAYPRGRFIPRPRPQLIADKAAVLAAIGDGRTCLINALTPEQHRGDPGVVDYGRAGHIAASVNVCAMDLVARENHAYLPEADLRKRFAEADATTAERVITYCGGGIAASSAALVLSLLGVSDVAVYDGSLQEWAADPTLPMERG